MSKTNRSSLDQNQTLPLGKNGYTLNNYELNERKGYDKIR